MTTVQLTGGLLAGHVQDLSPWDQALAGYFARVTNKQFAADIWSNLQLYRRWCIEQQVDWQTAKPIHVTMYLRWLQAQGWAESTVLNRFGVVTVFYKRAVIDDIVVKDPCVDIPRPKVDKGKQKRTWLTPLDMARMLEAAEEESPQTLALMLLMGVCGLRVAEACSLRIELMTRDQGYDVINFIGKGGNACHVALPVAVMRVVQTVIDGRTDGTVLLNQKGLPLLPDTAYRVTKRIAVKAGVDPALVGCHTLRRTCAATGELMGMTLRQIQLMLRHKDPKTTSDCYLKGANFDQQGNHQIAGYYSGLAA